jgi:hypothetical protein
LRRTLSRKKGVNAYILTINNFEGLLLITSIINGNMRTPKIYALTKIYILAFNYLRFTKIYIYILAFNYFSELTEIIES